MEPTDNMFHRRSFYGEAVTALLPYTYKEDKLAILSFSGIYLRSLMTRAWPVD